MLRRKGVPAPQKCANPKVQAAWAKDRDGRRALATLAWYMRKRAVPGPFHAHHLAGFGLTDLPHNDPLWWLATPQEVDRLVGRVAKPASLGHRRLGAASPEEAACPTLVVPLWETEHILAGFVGWHPGQTNAFQRLRPGSTGVGFLHARHRRHAPWGDRGVIAGYPTLALNLLAAGRRAGLDLPVVYVPPSADPKRAARLLAGRPWVYVHPSAFDRPEHLERRYRLLRLLDADQQTDLPIEAGVTRPELVGRNARPWAYWLAQVLGDSVESRHPDHAAELVRRLGGDRPLLDAVRRAMRRGAWEALEAALAPQPVVHRAVRVEAGFTVAETPAGWVWDETGDVVMAAYPAGVTAYRGGGRTRHRGVVVYAGRTYPFDTARLRRDPGGVVEAVLLRHGVHDAPAPHPRVLPHAAAVAAYFSAPT